MKRIVRISQKDLHEILMKETGGGFLQGKYRDAPEVEEPIGNKKYSFSLTEEQINFLEDILEEVNPDNDKEKEIIFTLSHLLRDTLIGGSK